MSKRCQRGKDKAKERAEKMERNPTEDPRGPLARLRRPELIPRALGGKGVRDESHPKRRQAPTETVGLVAVVDQVYDSISKKVWPSERRLCSSASAKFYDPKMKAL